MQGQLGVKLVTDLIREIAQKQHSGLLRLTRGKTIKAIFFENGEPKFAISNLTGEQLDHLLIKQSLVTAEQIEAAKARTGKVPRLASELVDMGVMSTEAMRKAVREQVMEIILSMFEWAQGDYQFGPPYAPGEATAWGLPIVQTEALTAGTAVVASVDPQWMQIWYRKDIEVQIGFINTQFKIGEKTIRADLRAALWIGRGQAICKVTGL